MNKSGVIVDGLILVGKIVIILFIILGILSGISLMAYSLASYSKNYATTNAKIDSQNISCVQSLGMGVNKLVQCQVPISFTVNDKTINSNLEGLSPNQLDPQYPVTIQYDTKKPENVSLLLLNRKTATFNLLFGLLLVVLFAYGGKLIYNMDSLASVVGIGQIGSMIVA